MSANNYDEYRESDDWFRYLYARPDVPWDPADDDDNDADEPDKNILMPNEQAIAPEGSADCPATPAVGGAHKIVLSKRVHFRKAFLKSLALPADKRVQFIEKQLKGKI